MISDRVLVQVLEQQKIKEILKLNFEVWGISKLSINEYLDREEILSMTEFSRNSLKTWMLSTSNDEILSSCETYSKQCFLGNTMGTCFVIASVFTPPEHRKNGYCSEMLTLLSNRLRSSGATAITLYSDIGPTFYSKLGWHLYPSISLIYDLTSPTVTVPVQIKGEFLVFKDLITRITVYNTLQINTTKQSPDRFVCLPSFNSLQWLQKRSEFYCNILNIPNFTHYGASFGNSFVFWYHEYEKPNVWNLILTITHCHSFNDFNHLLAMAVENAKLLGFKSVQIWDPKYSTGLYGWRLENRKESLSHLAVLQSDMRVEWIGNDKTGWC